MLQIVTQQKPFDCGVACISMWTHIDYPDVYAIALAQVGTQIRRGLLLREMRSLLKALAHPMRSVHHLSLIHI